MALSDLFNKAKKIINTTADNANKIRDAFQEGARKFNEALGQQSQNQESPARPAPAPTPAPAAPVASARVASANKITPDSFKAFLIAEGYKVYTEAGKPSTVYMYLDAVNEVTALEKCNMAELAGKIAAIVKKYDKKGSKEKIGSKSHDTVINALKTFQRFVKENRKASQPAAKAAKPVKTEEKKTSAPATNKGYEWVIEPQFARVTSFREGLASVRIDGKWGCIDKTGQIVIKPKFDYKPMFSDGIAQVREEGRLGYIDKMGKYIVKPGYDITTVFSEGLAAISKDGKWGFIDKTGKNVIKPEFDDAKYFSEGLAIVAKDGKFHFIDKTGENVIKTELYDVNDFSEGLAAVSKRGKWGFEWGFIDKTGYFIIPPEFACAYNFNEGLAAVSKYGKWGYIKLKK